MKALKAGDWSLIARYLKEEASERDLDDLRLLLQLHPELKAELEKLGRDGAPAPDTGRMEHFDADAAFDKLNQRFKNEGLL